MVQVERLVQKLIGEGCPVMREIGRLRVEEETRRSAEISKDSPTLTYRGDTVSKSIDRP